MIDSGIGQSGAPPTGMKIFGSALDVPRLTDVVEALERPGASVAIDVAGLPEETRPLYTEALLLQLQALHDRVGRPHAVLVHDADRWLAGAAVIASSSRLSEVTMIYSTTQLARLPRAILDSVDWVVTLGVRTGEMRAERTGYVWVWSRARDAVPLGTASVTDSETLQAITAGGAACRLSSGSEGTAAAGSFGAASASGK
jgi:hypothetical protein